jgi:hypothetical protein
MKKGAGGSCTIWRRVRRSFDNQRRARRWDDCKPICSGDFTGVYASPDVSVPKIVKTPALCMLTKHRGSFQMARCFSAPARELLDSRARGN